VAEVEDALGVNLPESYRTFFLHNGGGVVAGCWVVPDRDGSATLGEFLGPDQLIRMQHKGSAEVIPHDYIVIADGGGGTLAIKVKGDDIGSIWWADYDLAEEIDADEPTLEVMRRLADNFDAFLNYF
jgi:hypothetical protein